MVGKKPFSWWVPAGLGRAGLPLGLLALSGGAWGSAGSAAQAPADSLPVESPAAACAGGVSLQGLAAPAPSAGGPKFSLAAAACGPLAARPGRATPRVAAQLALYDTPAGAADEPAWAAAAAPTAPPRAPQATAKAAPRRAPAAAPAAAVQRIRALVPVVAEAARRHGIDPLLLHAVAHVESRHQADAHSHAGARGVMQVMPGTARRFGLGDPHRELLQPALNVDVGAEYLKTLQARFGNNLPLVLAAYNAGEGAVEKHGRRIPPYPETRAYVRDVLATYTELRRRLGVGPADAAGSV